MVSPRLIAPAVTLSLAGARPLSHGNGRNPGHLTASGLKLAPPTDPEFLALIYHILYYTCGRGTNVKDSSTSSKWLCLTTYKGKHLDTNRATSPTVAPPPSESSPVTYVLRIQTDDKRSIL